MLAFIGSVKILPDTRHDQESRLPDLVGGALLLVGISALALAIVQGEAWGWSSARVIISFLVAVIMIVAFLWSSRRHPAPVIELGLFHNRVFSCANIGTVLFMAAFSMRLLSVILWMQGHWHYSAIKVGLASAPGPAVVPIFAAVAEVLQAKARLKPGYIAALGILLFGVGIALHGVYLHDNSDYVGAFLPGWLVGGAGIGLALPTLVSSATLDLRPEQTATGSAIVTMSQQIGSVVGVSLLVAVLGEDSGAASLHLYRVGYIVAAVLSFFSVLAVLGISPKAREPEVGEGATSTANEGEQTAKTTAM
jgi:MFS family permease